MKLKVADLKEPECPWAILMMDVTPRVILAKFRSEQEATMYVEMLALVANLVELSKPGERPAVELPELTRDQMIAVIEQLLTQVCKPEDEIVPTGQVDEDWLPKVLAMVALRKLVPVTPRTLRTILKLLKV